MFARMSRGHMTENENLTTLLEKNNCRAMAVTALTEALAATRSFSQNGETKTEPDHKTRAYAATILLGYSDGRPIDRQMIQVSSGEKQLSHEARAEAIARALRLPAGTGLKILERKRKELEGGNGDGHANGIGHVVENEKWRGAN